MRLKIARTENIERCIAGRRKQRGRSRKIPIDERHIGKERDALTRSKGQAKKERERERERKGEEKKNRRRMDYRRVSKDGTYGSKNRNQSHWLKAAWPEKREST